MRPSIRPLTAAHGRCAGEGDGQNGETGWTTPTTAVPQSRCPRRRRCGRRAAGGGRTAPICCSAPPPHRKRDWQVPGGRVTNNVGCAALPENPHARPIPAGAAARGQAHAGHTMLRCAEPPPDWLPAQVGGTSSASTGGHPSKEFRWTTDWGRAPTHATVPLGGPPPLIKPFSRGGADPESRVAADVHQEKTVSRRPPPPQGPAMSAACASNGICGHSRPHAHEYQISRRLCDRQRNVCLSAIVPIWVFDPRLDTIVDRFGSQNVRKCTNVCPNVSGMVGRWKNANLLRTSAILSGWTYIWPTSSSVRRSGSRRWWDDRFSHTSAHNWQICHV